MTRKKERDRQTDIQKERNNEGIDREGETDRKTEKQERVIEKYKEFHKQRKRMKTNWQLERNRCCRQRERTEDVVAIKIKKKQY